jgi:CRP-like cAMP-binding protein
VTQLESSLEEIAFKSIPARLASLLVRLDQQQGGTEAVKGYTHQDLGELLGTYRETVTQTLNDFKSEGMIEIGRKNIVLLDRERLEELAES